MTLNLNLQNTKNIGTERKPHTSLFDPRCIKTPQIDTSAVYDAVWAGRSAVDISAETFLKMTFDRRYCGHAVSITLNRVNSYTLLGFKATYKG